MPREVTCDCGESIQLDENFLGSEIPCPNCDRLIPVTREPSTGGLNLSEHRSEVLSASDTRTDTPKRGLWSLMRKPEQKEVPTPSEEAHFGETAEPLPQEAPFEPAKEMPPTASVGSKRGLWALMKNNETPVLNRPVFDPLGERFRRRREAQKASAPQPEQSSAPDDDQFESVSATGEVDVVLDPEGTENAIAPPPEVSSVAVASGASFVQTTSSQQMLAPRRLAWYSLIFGVLSLPAAFLSIWPIFWARIPSMILGFAALLCGMMAQGDKREDGSRALMQNLSWVGLACGVLGMFAGPWLIVPLDIYGRMANAYTEGHLKQIATATQGYLSAHLMYPPGSIVRPGNGDDVPNLEMHSWMTLLLPHLPEGAGYAAQIHWDQPYDAPANGPILRQTIPSFLAAGADPSPVRQGFGVSHFAGVGGTVDLPDGTLAQAGVFSENSDTTREDITDGSSNTLMAGEIATEFPAWGEPRNWRTIGKGLNREQLGFGNARHSGAMFLMADGSVRYFSQKTDVKLLQALSTRNGGETVSLSE